MVSGPLISVPVSDVTLLLLVSNVVNSLVPSIIAESFQPQPRCAFARQSPSDNSAHCTTPVDVEPLVDAVLVKVDVSVVFGVDSVAIVVVVSSPAAVERTKISTQKSQIVNIVGNDWRREV